MSTADDTSIAVIVAEILADEDDAAWEAWTRDRMRLQGQLHELRAEKMRLASKLLGSNKKKEGARGRPSAREQRLAMGRGALLSLPQAAALLPLKDSEGRRWLREQGLVGDLEGREVVDWGRALDAPYQDRDKAASLPPPRRPSTTQKSLPRVRLGAPKRNH